MFVKSRSSTTGDTIVEVLIAIAIISVVVGGAYSIAGLSLNNIRQAQEHSVALKLAETQIEQLKTISKTVDIFGLAPGSCTMYDGGNDSLTVSSGPVDCTINNGIDYTISINRSNIGLSNTFIVTVRWDSIHGNTVDDNVTLVYNLVDN